MTIRTDARSKRSRTGCILRPSRPSPAGRRRRRDPRSRRADIPARWLASGRTGSRSGPPARRRSCHGRGRRRTGAQGAALPGPKPVSAGGSPGRARGSSRRRGRPRAARAARAPSRTRPRAPPSIQAASTGTSAPKWIRVRGAGARRASSRRAARRADAPRSSWRRAPASPTRVDRASGRAGGRTPPGGGLSRWPQDAAANLAQRDVACAGRPRSTTSDRRPREERPRRACPASASGSGAVPAELDAALRAAREPRSRRSCPTPFTGRPTRMRARRSPSGARAAARRSSRGGARWCGDDDRRR